MSVRDSEKYLNKQLYEEFYKKDSAYDEEESFIVLLTGVQERKMQELMDMLIVSQRLMLNICLRFSIFYANKKRKEVSSLREYPKRFGKIEYRFEPTLDSKSKMKDLIEVDVNSLVVTGINLLYSKLIK